MHPERNKPSVSQIDDLREERDRFVAFAFAAADLLVQLDVERRISFVSGAAQALLGVPAALLVGRDVRTFIDPGDHIYFDRLLDDIARRGRIEPSALRLVRGDKTRSRVMVGGCCFSGRSGDYFMAMMHLPAIDTVGRDPETQLLTPGTFAETAKRLALSPGGAEGNQMVMLRLGGLSVIEDGLTPELCGQLRGEIAGLLRSVSLGGDTAAQIDREAFSLVQKRGTDTAHLQFSLKAVAQSIDPDASLSVTTATVNLDANELGDQDAGRAVAYCIKQFSETEGADFALSSLGDGFSDMVNRTMTRVTEVRSTLGQGAFTLAYQPIVELASGKLHHFEVLSRFQPGQSPYELVTFSEQVGLAEELDLAVCEKALRAARGAAVPEHIALNLSGRSIQSADFTQRLMSMIDELVREPKRVIFEITESSAIQNLEDADRVIQALRRRGHPLCLDDFGAGFSAYNYLRRFPVDFIKLDGAFLRAAFADPREAALIRSLAVLCRELRCGTIGEMIETRSEASAAKALGVDFGQGYHFGRPAPEPRYDLV
jgi:EAL domain-containing protein (putative c-di-GMP-specific phosphodiesterase class I)